VDGFHGSGASGRSPRAGAGHRAGSSAASRPAPPDAPRGPAGVHGARLSGAGRVWMRKVKQESGFLIHTPRGPIREDPDRAAIRSAAPGSHGRPRGVPVAQRARGRLADLRQSRLSRGRRRGAGRAVAGVGITHVAGIEARGFLLAGAELGPPGA